MENVKRFEVRENNETRFTYNDERTTAWIVTSLQTTMMFLHEIVSSKAFRSWVDEQGTTIFERI